MTTTTTAGAGTARDTVPRRATLGLVGGALWVLLPLAWSLVSLEDQEFGTLAFVAVAASYWIFAVLPPALLVVGHTALRSALGAGAGKAGATGIVLACLGLGAMATGNGIEVASLSAGGGTVAVGHAIFLVGFLVSIAGALLVGITVIRRRPDPLSRIAGWVLVLALPLGIGIAVLGGLIAPEGDGGFWAAIAVPTGIAWVLLGASLRSAARPASAEFASTT